MNNMRNRKFSGRGSAVLVIMGLLLASPTFAATLKKIVAVSRFENKTSWKGQVMLDDGMADQLTDALMQSGQFIVLERQTLGDVMAEQDLATSGRAQASKSAQTGKLISAQILVKGAVTEFENKSAGSGTGIGFGPVKLANKREEAHVGLIIRLIDTTTGQVLDSQRVEGTAAAGGMAVGVNAGGVSFGTEGFKKTPLGKATQIAIDNAVNFIANKLKNVPFQGRVIKASGEDIYVSAGTRTGVAAGDVFTVYKVGEALVDPSTGEQLGAEETKLGTIKVYQVDEKFSKAKAEGKLGEAKAGDVIRSQ
jgi:curli biogenesis system outer membrane secretion channel CsgG